MLRKLSFLAAVVLVMSLLLSACGDTAANPTAVSAPTATTAAVPTDTTAPPAPTDTVAAAPTNTTATAGSGSGNTGGFVVGYSAAGLIDTLQITWSEGVKKAIEDAGGKVIIVDSQNKIAKQVSDIEDLLSQNINFLVVNPVDEAGIVPAVEAANKANVPVITIDRAAGGGQVASHIGFDNYKAGFDAGEYIAKVHGNKGKVAQLMGQAGTSVARERAQGFQDAIKKYPDMKIVFEQPADWDTAKAQTATEDLLSSNPDVVGIWAHADAMIMGAVQALKAANKLNQVTTVGMGMYGGGPEAIKAGNLTASWELFPDQLGKIAGETVVKLHNGQKVDPKISTNMVFVTKDNIDQYLKPAGPTPTTATTGSGSGTKTGGFKVGYSAAGLIDTLQITWSEGVKKAIEDAGGQVIIVDSQNKIAKQVSDIEDLLSQNINYLVVNPVDEAGIVPAVEAANKANVPVITIDRAAGGGQVASHIGFDNYKAGFDAGEYIAKVHGGKGKVAQLMGQAGTSVARERSQGFQDSIKKYPDMKIVFEQPADWDTAKAQTATEDLLAANPDVVGIWAHADAMIMGAVQALKGANKLNQVTTVGMGMYGGGPEAIKAGDLTASWELFPDQLGKIAGETVVKLHNGQKVEPKISTNMVFVTKDNIDQYLKK